MIDKRKYIQSIFSRGHCTIFNNELYKDLKYFQRDLKEVIIVDNTPRNYTFQKSNGIPITTWRGEKNDKGLMMIIDILEFLADVNDVRYYISQFVYNDQIDFTKAFKIISEKKQSNQNSPRPYFLKPLKAC